MTSRTRLLAPALLVLVIGACKKDATEPSHPEFYTQPVEVSSGLTFITLGAGYNHSCGITVEGATYCWGWNDQGQLGTAVPLDTCDEALPCTGEPQVVSGQATFTAVSPALLHTCALTEGGTAFCWGGSVWLGTGQPSGPLPQEVVGGLRFASLTTAVGDYVSCGLAPDGRAYCWGPDDSGRGGLGTGATGSLATPTAVGGDLRFQSLAVGQSHTCGVSADGTGYCWGGNWYGQLGIGSAGGAGGALTKSSPSLVIGGQAFTQVTAGLSHSCALTAAGGVYCWGSGTSFGTTDGYVHTPVAVDNGVAFARIHGGGLHTCGLTAEGVAYCWGQNSEGQLGDGSTTDRETPTPVSGELRFSSLVAGGGHTCGLAENGHAYCWGANPYGQVGRPPSHVTPDS